MKPNLCLAAIVAALISAPLHAQSRGENFTAPYTIIDHPSCAGTGHVAFVTEIDATTQTTPEREEGCFIYERQDRERIKLPTACSDTTLTARQNTVLPPMYSARLYGSITTCMSPAGRTQLDSQLAVDVSVNVEEETFSLNTDEAEISRRLKERLEQGPHARIDFRLGDDGTPSEYSIKFKCIPADIAAEADENNTRFLAVNEAPQILFGSMDFFLYPSGGERPLVAVENNSTPLQVIPFRFCKPLTTD